MLLKYGKRSGDYLYEQVVYGGGGFAGVSGLSCRVLWR